MKPLISILFSILFISTTFGQIFQSDSNTVVLYHFDETQGNILHDYSENHFDGILHGNPTWTGQGLFFHGDSDYVEVAHRPALNPNLDSWTVEVIFKTNMDSLVNQNTNFSSFLISKNTGDFINGYGIAFDWQSRNVYSLLDDSIHSLVGGYQPTTFDDTLYHQVAFTYIRSQNRRTFYFDYFPKADAFFGQLVTINPSNNLLIGKYIQSSVPSTSYYWGTIDEIRISNIARDPGQFITAVEQQNGGSNILPSNFSLKQNYPNPFNPTTTIQYSIPQHSNVTLKVYDILGNEVATLVNEEKERGIYSVSFDASQLSSGMYLYRLQAGSFIETKKMILVK